MRLPVGYTKLEYIESTGTQYIDTGFKPNNNTRVKMDSRFKSKPSGNNVGLFGSRTAANNKNYALLFIPSTFRSDYNNAYDQIWPVSAVTRRVYDKNKETTIIDGIAKSYSNRAFQTDYAMTLFALNSAGTVQWHASMILYSCQIYDNGNLIRDFVPCIDPTETVGLYDVVGAKFYSNAGTGVFIAGPEISNDAIYVKVNGTWKEIRGVKIL